MIALARKNLRTFRYASTPDCWYYMYNDINWNWSSHPRCNAMFAPHGQRIRITWQSFREKFLRLYSCGSGSFARHCRQIRKEMIKMKTFFKIWKISKFEFMSIWYNKQLWKLDSTHERSQLCQPDEFLFILTVGRSQMTLLLVLQWRVDFANWELHRQPWKSLEGTVAFQDLRKS